MKAYVVDYKTSSFKETLTELCFGPEPLLNLRYATRELATADCVHLNHFGPHMEAHRCAFAVDQLPQGDFGIICVCHPIASNQQARLNRLAHG